MKVVISEALSSEWDRRFVVVDETTGQVLDDAQGYGYRTAENAHRAYSFKSATPAQKKKRDALKREVRQWCAAHQDFMDAVEQATLWAFKDGETFGAPELRHLLDQYGLTPPFSVADLQRHR